LQYTASVPQQQFGLNRGGGRLVIVRLRGGGGAIYTLTT